MSGPERLLQASRSGEMELARESHFNMLELSPTGVLAPGIVPKDVIWPIPSPFHLVLAPLCFGSIPRKIRRGRAPLRGPLKCSVTERWKNLGKQAGEAARLKRGARFISLSDWSATQECREFMPHKVVHASAKEGKLKGPRRPWKPTAAAPSSKANGVRKNRKMERKEGSVSHCLTAPSRRFSRFPYLRPKLPVWPWVRSLRFVWSLAVVHPCRSSRLRTSGRSFGFPLESSGLARCNLTTLIQE